MGWEGEKEGRERGNKWREGVKKEGNTIGSRKK